MARLSVFVFGSNLAGIHGRGSAREALRNHGAVWGQGEGPHGSSYAIPTKDHQLRPRPLADVGRAINKFMIYAREHPEQDFVVVKVGCGLAGFTELQIAPLFGGASSNVTLPDGWRGWRSPAHAGGTTPRGTTK